MNRYAGLHCNDVEIRIKSRMITNRNLAASGGMELSLASDMITDSQSALGLSLEETSELVDKMAKASSKSNTSVTQLGDAILTIGGTAKNLAGGTTELSTALGILADSGIKGAEGGTALRNMLNSLTAPTKDASNMLNEMGVSVFDAEGNMRSLNDIFSDLSSAMDGMTQQGRMNVVSTLFNARDMKSANALLAATATSVETLEKTINSSFEDSSITLQSFGIDLQSIADSFDETITAEDFAAQMLENYGLEAEQAGLIFTGLSSIAGDTGNRFEQLSAYIDDAAGAAQSMADTQLDNLSGDITKFKSALEGARIAVSDRLTPTLREFVKLGTSGLSDVTKAFEEDGLEGAVEAFGLWLADMLDNVTSMLPKLIEAGGTLLNALATGFAENIPQVITALTDTIGTVLPQLLETGQTLLGAIFTGIVDNLPEMLTIAVEIITTLANNLAESLPTLVPTLVDMVLTIVETLTNPDVLMPLLEAALAIIMGLTDGILEALPILIERLPEIIENIVNTLVEFAPELLEASIIIIEKLVEGILSNLPQLVTAAFEIITTLIDGIISYFGDLIDVGADMIDKIESGIKDKISSAWEWGKDLVSSFADGITDSFWELEGALEDFGGMIYDYIHFSEPDKGALAGTFHTFAPDMMKTFAEGLADNAHLVEDEIDSLMRNVRADFETPMTSVVNTSFSTQAASSENSANTPQTATINLSIDGKIMATVLAPYIDIIQGKNIRISGRGRQS